MKIKHKIGNTVYKLMSDISGETHIVETVYGHLPVRKIFGIPIYKKVIESINYIPVNLSTLTIMFNILNLDVVEKASDELPYAKYEVITSEMNDKLKSEYNKRLDDMNLPNEIAIRISAGKVPNSEVVKGFVKDGWHYFATENFNSMRRSHFVYRSGLYEGYLHLFSIDEIGFNSDDAIVSNVSSVILPRKFMRDVLNVFGFYNSEGEGK